MRRRIFLVLFLLLIAVMFYYWPLITYGVGQGWGQLKIIRDARPVEEFLADPTFPDSLKARLRLIQAARKFAIDSLGLNNTDNYTSLYDQKGEEIMWVIIACEPFRLAEKRWDFPVIGSVPYKGFFDKAKAQRERDALEKEGWDVGVRNPDGWSTLGWFTDPILSGMLRRSEGDLASLIIHEMVHATIYVKDSSDFNENLASFIGDRGAELFLLRTFGDTSRQYQEYIHQDGDYGKWWIICFGPRGDSTVYTRPCRKPNRWMSAKSGKRSSSGTSWNSLIRSGSVTEGAAPPALPAVCPITRTSCRFAPTSPNTIPCWTRGMSSLTVTCER